MRSTSSRIAATRRRRWRAPWRGCASSCTSARARTCARSHRRSAVTARRCVASGWGRSGSTRRQRWRTRRCFRLRTRSNACRRRRSTTSRKGCAPACSRSTRQSATGAPPERCGQRSLNVAHEPAQLERRPRAVAIGTFDGVHLGHRAVIGAAVAAGPGTATVLTFHPHPRTALSGNRVELISTLDRRLELLSACGVEDVLVVEFTPELASLSPEEFARDYLAAIGAEVVVAGTGFRFGRGRSGDVELLSTLGFDARQVPLVEGVSSTRIRQLAEAGDVEGAARLLRRPLEVDGTVVPGAQRGGPLGLPTAKLRV